MNILHTVEFYPPSRGGSQEVVRQISERLVKKGHEVTVATTRLVGDTRRILNGVSIETFDISGNKVRGFRGEIERYQDFLQRGAFDIMLNYAAQQWTADLAFPLLDSLPYRKVLVPCGFSGLNYPGYLTYFEDLPDILRRYDHLVFHASDYQDIRFVKSCGIGAISIIPNGAAMDEFEAPQQGFRRRNRISESLPLILTVGSHTGSKGHRAVLDAFRRTKIGAAALVIIGNKVPGSSCLNRCRCSAAWARFSTGGKRRVLLLDPPRDEVIAAYQSADLFVFASNIEYSPLVLYESAAAGLPFLTTACGNAEEIAAWTGAGEIIPAAKTAPGWIEADVSALAGAMDRLLDNPGLREKLGSAGASAVRQNFNWDRISMLYEELYFKLIAGGSIKPG